MDEEITLAAKVAALPIAASGRRKYTSRRALFTSNVSEEELEQIIRKCVLLASNGSPKHLQILLDSMYGLSSYTESDMRDFVSRLVTVIVASGCPQCTNKLVSELQQIVLPTPKFQSSVSSR